MKHCLTMTNLLQLNVEVKNNANKCEQFVRFAHRTGVPPAAVAGVRLPMAAPHFHQFFLALLSALAWSGSAPLASAESSELIQSWEVSDRLSVKEIYPGIWVHTSRRKLKNGLIFPSNGLIVRNNDELILIDTAWGTDVTEDLLSWVESEIGLPISKAIVSHFHDDRMSGISILKAHGIKTLSNSLTRVLGNSAGLVLPEAISGLELGSTVTIGNVEVFYPGAGHTEDNIVVWVPEAKVLFGGCSVRSPEFSGLGNTEDANIGSWPKIIHLMQEKYPSARLVVPGHGSVGDATLLSYTRGLFDD